MPLSQELGTRVSVAWAKAYLRNKWHLDPCSRLATIDIGRKLGSVPTPPPFWEGEAGSPSNTMWPGSPDTCEIPPTFPRHSTVRGAPSVPLMR